MAPLQTGCATESPAQRSSDDHPQHEPARLVPSAGGYSHYVRSQLYLMRQQPRQATAELKHALSLDSGSPYLLVALGKVFFEQGYFNQALEHCKRALHLRPTFADAHLLMGQIHQEGRNYPLAAEAFELAIEAASNDPKGYLALGALHASHGRKAEEARVYERLVRNVPGAAEGYFRLGELALGRQDLEAAEKYYRQSLDEDITLQSARLQLARVLEARGELSEAIKAYDDLLNDEPNQEEVLFTLIRLNLLQGNRATADSLIEQAKHNRRTDTQQITRLGAVCFDVGSYELAMELFKQALELDPGLDKVRVYIGSAHYAKGEPGLALGEYARVPLTSRYWIDARLQVGRIYLEQGRFEQAVHIYTELIRRKPRDPALYQQLAEVYAQQGDFPRALKVVNRGLQAIPSDLHLRFVRGGLYRRSGQLARGISEVESVLQSNPDHVNALLFLVTAFADLGEHLSEAERLAERAQALRPNSAAVAAGLGRIYHRIGRLDQALIQFEEAHRLEPEQAEHLAHLGDVYQTLGRVDDSRKAYEKALQGKLPTGLAEQIRRKLESTGAGRR